MATEQAIKEINRFLASERAEVLCIRGKWGVGKTFAWRRYLGEMQKSCQVINQDYAYVSLFGLNSLDDLRYAIFESTVPLDKALTGPTAETFGALCEKGLNFGRKTRAWLGPALSSIGLGEIGNALSRSAFLLVRNQLICLDDLERAGDGLKSRDILGIASFLKEQRNCRVVLLLNDEAMDGDDKAEFRRLLEKVVDISISFEPTPREAAAIAITNDQPIGVQLRLHVETLGITNIRVIKKIEALALRLADLLEPYRPEFLRQAITACVLSGWAVFEPDHAPSLKFIREHNSVLLSMQNQNNEPSDDIVVWRDKLSALPFSHADDFDRIIMNGVAVGYFAEESLLNEVKTIEQSISLRNRDNSFSRAWDRYHNSLTDDDDAVVEAVRLGALENVGHIESTNLNATLHLLREFGRESQADELARAYVAAHAHDRRFLNLRNHHFMSDQRIDPALENEFRVRHAEFRDEREPSEVLLEISKTQGWNDEDQQLIAELSVEEFVTMFEKVQGPELRQMVRMALRMAPHTVDDGQGQMRTALYEALNRIASKSPLRARRLKSWGFQPTV